MKAAFLPQWASQGQQPAQMPAPSASPPVPSLEAVFGAAPKDAEMGFIPGMYNAFKGQNAGALISTQPHHQPGFEVPIHESMKNFGADGSFLDKLPGKKRRASRQALADAVDRAPRRDEEEDFGEGAP